MARRQEQNPSMAWESFAASGSIADYLKYRALVNRADAVTGISGGNVHAKRGSGAAGGGAEGKRPPDHGAY